MLMTMADTFQRATNKPELAAGMKDYARSFMKDFRNSLMKEENR